MALVQTVRDLTTQLYDTKTRPALVAKGLSALGAEKLFNAKQIELVASLTTMSGLVEEGTKLQVIATPYIQKAKCADGRKELVYEGVEIAQECIVKPTRAVAAPYVQKGVDKATESLLKPTQQLAAPYVARLTSSARYQRALAGLQHLRAHPREAAHELKSKAIDLIKYDELAAYREYVQSPEFQADTLKLLREDLPAVARDAARRGMALLHTRATALSEELAAKRAALVGAWHRGYELGRTLEIDDLRSRASALVAELQEKVGSGELRENIHEVIARLTKTFGLDKYFGSVNADSSPSSDADAAPEAHVPPAAVAVNAEEAYEDAPTPAPQS
mmetsp:Transcript_9285/g.24014  ORF Transcript_9285/g.24014 Transcript_9285/m.24014 type:complete len:333 (-) Transcript_9285:375-1373(-)